MGYFSKYIRFASCIALTTCSLIAEDESAGSAAAGKNIPFSHYQSIVDREPFGTTPPDFNPEITPSEAAAAGKGGSGGRTQEQISEEEQKIISALRISALNLTPAGVTMVGFTDTTTKRNHYLEVGSDEDGWEVKSADVAAQTVVMVKDGVEAEVKVGEAAGGKGKKASVTRNSSVKTPAASVPMTLQEGPAVPSGLKGGTISRLRARRRQKEEMKQRERAEQQRTREELEALKKASEEEKKRREAEEEQRAIDKEEQRMQLEQLRETLRREREQKQLEQQQRQMEAEGAVEE